MRRAEVAVVGAGAAGLVAARELLREGHAVAVFEKSDRAGGTWAYDPRADADPLSLDPGAPGAVHGSLYASLRTNLPRELMGFSGFPLAGRVFAGDPRTFPGHREVLAFLDAFAEESGVAALVRLRAEVLRVRPLGQGQGEEQWAVAWRGEDGEVAEEVFDAVVVCNGRCTVPLVPKIRGIDKWRGKQMHSHNYRTPEPFRDQVRVLCTLPLISAGWKTRYSEDRLGKIELYQNVWLHAEIDRIQDDGPVQFAEGSAVSADIILYCTGYRYHFPFLDFDGLTVDDNRVGPMYKHVFPTKYAPNLSFVGLPYKTIIFQSLELESKWVAAVLSGRATLPSEEGMVAAVREEYRRMEEDGRPKRHTHSLWPEWVEYMNWLAEQVGEPQLEARRRDMYERALKCIWSLDDRYRDRWDEEEENNGGDCAPQGSICHTAFTARSST
ncbi:Flavin-containing monooxygenase FMO GS-OX-like 2 [Dichanthelium oligosanthes]|uniref:Flavin-containing monooxygenase n=1 Tax=Dichanthelium oligosanthes TaxID=888268 RepID=A0A1E5URJ6_9POAL|nr:Flavin-containing monooxygenase FMO GS-OX-like 2 [Dichanthelium oligosanthes]